jgi:hypothetical protein
MMPPAIPDNYARRSEMMSPTTPGEIYSWRREGSFHAVDSKVLGIELAAHTRISFNSTNREPIVRQQRRRRFYPCIFFSRI